MFDLVQNYQPSNNEIYQNTHEQYHNIKEENDNNNNTGVWNDNSVSHRDIDNRIEVSDDSDDEDDSEEVSDSESDSDNDEEIPKLSLAKTEDMSLSVNDVKKITVKEANQPNNDIELEEVDSLDEIEDDDDEEEEKEDKNVDNDTNKDAKNITVLKEETDTSSDTDDVDYHKLKVTELKAIAEAKGLTNYKSLKKDPLIDLIKSAE